MFYLHLKYETSRNKLDFKVYDHVYSNKLIAAQCQNSYM